MHRSVLEDAEFGAWAAENVVVVVGHPKGSHKSADVAKPAKGEPKKQCSLYPGIACEDHEKAFVDLTGKEPGGDKDKDKAPPKKKKDGEAALPHVDMKGFPSSFVISPDGTIVKHGADRKPDTCRSFLEEQQKKFDENPIPASKAADVKKAVADAEKAAKAGSWKAALAAIGVADARLEGKLPKALAERVKGWLEAANAKAVARFAEAKAAKDVAAQTKAVKALREEFGRPLACGTLPVVADLDAWLAEHGSTPASAPEPSK
jgi:hypothetical protein